MTTPPAVLKVADVLASETDSNQIVYIKNNQVVDRPGGATLYKASEYLTADAFEKHSSACGMESRGMFLSAIKPNLFERWQEIDKLQKAGKVSSPEAEAYKRLLEDMAQLIVGLHHYFEKGNKVAYNIQFSSDRLKNAPDLQHISHKGIYSFSEGTAFKIYLSEAKKQIETLGDEFNKKFSHFNFAQLDAPKLRPAMPEFTLPFEGMKASRQSLWSV